MAIHLINGPKEWRRTRGPINLPTLREAEGPFIKDVSNFPRFLNTPNSLCRHLFHTPINIVITYFLKSNSSKLMIIFA